MAFGREKKTGQKGAARSPRAKLDATPPWETRIRVDPVATAGPFDERDAPADDVARVDLGALRVPVAEGLDLQVEVDPNTQHVVSVTLAGPTGQMQLGVFAAPRNEGIWDDVRAEIAASLREQRGKPADREGGAFGTELTGELPGGESGTVVPVRFVGIDGPRWFLRAMFAGSAADPAAGGAFEDLLRQVVVVRGTEPLPVRDPVPLTLPKDAVLPEQ